ncbi:hypothetical protein [Sphingosinicella terrae]|uniref:hypothetical protein n=1 Tax=Sphingosinicella terrae TaxID=2172047 RepID=UPI0013B3DD2A|nr:hypothetical protein [Sphingosinicella terrae]
MATLAPRRSRVRSERGFFVAMAAAMLFTVLVGFAPTYYLLPWLQGVTVRGVAGAAALTPIVHVHAIIFSAWILLFIAQTSLVAIGRTDLHRWLGPAALAFAPLVVAVGLWTAIDSGRARNTPPGWANAEAFLALPFTSIGLFGGFVAAGFVWRRRSDVHKRLMLLGTIAMMVPALARIVRNFDPPLLPPGVAGALVLVNLFLAALVAFDLSRRGRIHPVTFWGVAIHLLSWPFRLHVGETGAWQAFAGSLLS